MRDTQTTALRPPDDSKQILHVLSHGTVGDADGMLRWSSNATLLVAVTFETLRILAVYKPQRGERPLWDFPDGTLCRRETAAFEVSSALGWHIVPPTVLRDGPRGTGSVQYYVPHDPEVNYFTLDDSYLEALRRMAVFDYLINNADRKGGHCLLDDRGHLWGIDHGIGFHPSPKLRTVIWDFAGQRVPDNLLQDVEGVYCLIEDTSQALRGTLDHLLDHAEISAFLARMRRLLQRRELPRPGAGPNYPWPPI